MKLLGYYGISPNFSGDINDLKYRYLIKHVCHHYFFTASCAVFPTALTVLPPQYYPHVPWLHILCQRTQPDPAAISIIPSFFILETKSLESLALASCLDPASKVYPTTPNLPLTGNSFKLPRTTLQSCLKAFARFHSPPFLPHITRSTCLAPKVKSPANDPSLRVSPNKTCLTVTHISLADGPTALLSHLLFSLEKPLSRSSQGENTDGNENIFSNTQFPLAFYTVLTLTMWYKKPQSLKPLALSLWPGMCTCHHLSFLTSHD